MRTYSIAVIFLTFGSVASCQRVYWGVVGGTSFTPDFPRYEISGPADAYGNPAFDFQHLPDTRSLILGALLEFQFSDQFAVEADILHRPLRTKLVYTEFPASGGSVTSTNSAVAANAWEFPIMLKWNLPYALADGRLRPFLEGGPAFRTSQNDSAVLPSQFGVTAGAGVALHLGKLRLTPTIRYTRWEKETHFPPYPTKADQLEFLTSLAWRTPRDPLRMNGHRLALGLVGGLSALGAFYYPETGVRERVGYQAGVSGQFELLGGVAIEADAIYKPLHSSFSEGQGFTVLTWDFPVLAKYHVARLGPAAFVEAGPSFRSSGNHNGYSPSHIGVTAGLGVETRKSGAVLSTTLRYTRWAKDGVSLALRPAPQRDYPRTNANALELIFGIGF